MSTDNPNPMFMAPQTGTDKPDIVAGYPPPLPRHRPKGVTAYLTQRPGAPDLFEWDRSQMSFPCCACKHSNGPVWHCRDCAHYAL